MPLATLTNGESGLNCRNAINAGITAINNGSTGGNGTADAAKLMKFNADGGISLGKSDVSVSGLAVLDVQCSDGVGVQCSVAVLGTCYWAYPLGASSQGFHVHAGPGVSAISGYTTDLTGSTHGTDNVSFYSDTWNDDFALVVNSLTGVTNRDTLAILASGNIESYKSGTSHTSGSDKTVLAFAIPSGTNTLTLPALTGTAQLRPAVKQTSSNYTVGTTDPNELYGGIIYVTDACTITIPAVVAGASFTVVTIGAKAVSVDPNGSDLIVRDGTAQADGEKITNLSTAGDIAVLTYYDATGWSASTNGWTNGG